MSTLRASRLLAAAATVLLAAGLTATATAANASVAGAPSKAALTHALLVKSDLPAGYKAHGATSTSSGKDDSATPPAVAKCLGVKVQRAKYVAEGISPTFSQGTTTISSSAESYSSHAQIAQDTAELNNPKFAGCFKTYAKKELTTSLPSGSKLKSINIHVGKLAGAPSNVIGAITLSMTVSFSGQTIDIHLEVVAIAGDNVEASVFAEAANGTLPTALVGSLAKKVAGRIEKL